MTESKLKKTLRLVSAKIMLVVGPIKIVFTNNAKTHEIKVFTKLRSLATGKLPQHSGDDLSQSEPEHLSVWNR